MGEREADLLLVERVQSGDREAFIRAYRALPNFRGDSAFGVNAAKNWLVANE